MASLNVFVKTMDEIDTAAEVYLELFQTCMPELFAKIVDSLRKKGSFLTCMVLNTPHSYREIICYYKRDETRALYSAELQVITKLTMATTNSSLRA